MKLILTLGALILSASFALAADGDKPRKPGEGGDKPRPNPEEMFKKADTNNDGSLSKEEFLATPRAKENAERAEKIFTAKDKDKDGKLSKEEFAARPEGDRKPGEGGDKPRKPGEGGDKKP
ncbi:MAG: EF-hand domain-containing protein [Roseimicrobium sp.]